jgi:molybdopterin-guanine dinucleotide biosynthesis protein A
MGRPKQDLPFGAGTLLECVIAAARSVADELVLVGDAAAAARLGLRSAGDLEPGAGPLSGLAGGLASCPEGLHALLACDLPFLDPHVLLRMAELGGAADAVVPWVGERQHPACALYRSTCLEPARASVAAGRRRMEDLLGQVRVRTVTPEELRPLDLARTVTNINTPEDYRRALEVLDHERS